MGPSRGVRLLVVPAMLLARVAAADTQECISQSEQAQQARSDGHFTAARDLFHACAAADCPAAVRGDCEKSFDDLGRSMPSVVFVVRHAGRDVTSARVLIDGAEVQGALEGRSIPLDPGHHRVKVEGAGDEQDVVVHEGEKNRLLQFETGDAVDTSHPPPPRPVVRFREHGLAPWVVAIGGLVIAAGGVALTTVGQAIYDNALSGCTLTGQSNTYTCSVRTGYMSQSASDASRRSDETTGVDMRNGGIIALGVGGVALISGLLWHFAERTGPVAASAWFAPGAAGVQLRIRL